MALGGEPGAVQRPFVRHAVEAGWTYLSPDEALKDRDATGLSPRCASWAWKSGPAEVHYL